MLTTAVSVLAAIALLLPGFIIVELSAARGARSSRSDLELALRALTYALLVHLVFSAWTAHLVQQIDAPRAWNQHVGAIVLYSAVVLVVVPAVLGVLTNIAIGSSAVCTADSPRRVRRPPLTTCTSNDCVLSRNDQTGYAS